MTGFKSGASEDNPLSGDTSDTVNDTSDDAEATNTAGDATTTNPDQSAGADAPDDWSRRELSELESHGGGDTDTGQRADGVNASQTVPTPTDGQLPWLFTRNSITDGREQTVQLHLQTATVDHQRRARSTLEDRLDERVAKADLREAALLVGLTHVNQVIDILKAWGYGAD